jgi:hypothetical protein
MQVIVTALLDQLYGLLAQGSKIVTLYEQKDASFIPSLTAWLVESETVLEKNRRPQVAEIAGIRAQLLSASHAVYDKRLFVIPSTEDTRKSFHASAAILFGNAQNVLSSVYAAFAARKEEAEKFVRQMLLISLQKNSFYPIWNSDLGISERLSNLWQSFAADKDLVQGTRQVLSSVHYVDALRILGETIDDLKL